MLLALWAAVALGAAVLTGALLWPREGAHDRVAAYIEQVNEAQRPHAAHYGAIAEVYRGFRLEADASGEQLAKLRLSAERIAATRAAVEAVEAPPEAAELRKRTLALLRHEEAMARELIAIAEYLPKLDGTEKPLVAAGDRLRAALDGAETPAAQADALRAYVAAVAKVRATVDAIEAPPLLAPAHDGHVAQLARHGAATRELQAAVRANDREAVAKALERLQRAADSSPAAAKAQKAAIAAYGDRVAEVRRLAAALEEERVRLERALR